MLNSVQLKTFIAARDFTLTQAFYQALGFQPGWHDGPFAYFSHGEHCAFPRQNFYVPEHAQNLVMHLLVDEVDGGWPQVSAAQLDQRFGVLWRIDQNTAPAPH